MESSLDLVKGVESVNNLIVKRVTLRMVINGMLKRYRDAKVALAL